MASQNMEKPAWTDFDTEQVIGNLLRIGVLISAAVVLLGGVLYLHAYGGLTPHRSAFAGEPSELRTVSGVIRSALRGEPRSVIELGLLLLIATPIARVAFSVWAFARERDRLYVGITLVVLAILIYSLLHA